MDENNIQTLREDLTEEYHNLAKSHTAAIEQFLKEFNDNQMMFRLEVEAYEKESLAANRTPTIDDHEAKPTRTTTIEARQEGPAPADTRITPDQQPATKTLPEPVPTGDTQHEAATKPDSVEKSPSPTPPSELPDQPHVPEDILGILEKA